MTWDLEETLFSTKCFAAVVLAHYVAVRIGLERPYWADVTTYFVAQPLAGAVLSKAVFRLVGTVMGAGAAVLLVPTLVTEPLVLSAGLAAWIGLCVYVSLLERSPRAYTFLAAGLTAAIIGFPSVDAPAGVFELAVLRVEEITVGILAASLIHGVLFPRTVADRLLARTEAVISAMETATRHTLARLDLDEVRTARRRIVVDLGELDQLAVQLPYDTAGFLPRLRLLRALQDRMLELVPVEGAVGDRLAQLEGIGGAPSEVDRIIDWIDDWLAGEVTGAERPAGAADIRTRLAAVIASTGTTHWRDMLVLNLCVRLVDLVRMHEDARLLLGALRTRAPAADPETHIAELVGCSHRRAWHRDHGLALRSGIGAFAGISIGCAIWIGTAWPDGATALVMTCAGCILFSNVDRPAPVVHRFLVGSTLGVAVAVIYAFAVLPRAVPAELLVAVCAPPLLLVGTFIARPATTVPALGAIAAFLICLGLGGSYQSTFGAFLNTAVALLAGVAFASVSTRFLQTVGAATSVSRILRSGWRDAAMLAAGVGGDERRWASRMLDRIGLLVPRVGLVEGGAGVGEALATMRIGLIAGRLRDLGRRSLPAERAVVDEALDGISKHFEGLRSSRRTAAPEGLLLRLDRGLARYAADGDPARSREGLVLLTSLRRDLFPAAAGYGGEG